VSALPPLVRGIADLPAEGGDCGCCAGIDAATPPPIGNRPGLASIAYRPGSYAAFRHSQLARLSGEERPALLRLKSRVDDDFTIALIDAWSCVLDVLAFYQERNANEAWLGTATERQSIIELGRLIGYRPRPGVAAASDLVFLMDDPAGAAAAVPAVAIPAGTRVQSIPGPGETAQTFETVEAIDARVAWNALTPRKTRPTLLRNGDTGTWIAGVVSGLRTGDVVLIVGSERFDDPTTSRWDVRTLVRVAIDSKADHTRLEWVEPLDSVDAAPGTPSELRLFVFRVRASLFGWNAPHPNLLSDAARTRYGFDADSTSDWTFTIDETLRRIHLDSIQERFVVGGWVALTRPADVISLYRTDAAIDDGRAAYAVSARVTRLTLDTEAGLNDFEAAYRMTSVYGGSEELAFAEAPETPPVQGDAIELNGLVEGLLPGHRLIVRGRRAQSETVGADLELASPDDPASTKTLPAQTRVTLLGAPVPVSSGSADYVWHLRAPGGFAGFATAPLTAFADVAADATAEIFAEVATLAEVAAADDTHAQLQLDGALAAAFDRTTTVVHANVAAATHGETTQEVLGDGNAAKPFQSMRLKQSPLTYVSAATETGVASSLEVRVGDIAWREVPTLYGQAPAARVFETFRGDDGSTVVQFGDGAAGARLPSGRNNVVATYRKGIGIGGSVAADTLKTALDRPLGLRDVFNPLSAAGGRDPETLATARDGAPVTTLTLGRVVSLRNYEDFARGFAGIAKARADTVWDGVDRRIVVTVAGPGGETVDPDQGDVFDNLIAALRGFGDPFVRVTLVSYRPAYFRLAARILVYPDHLPDVVLARVEAALRDAYGFDQRGFAPLVAASEVIGTIHTVAGVAAVDLDLLHRTVGSGSAVILHQRLLASPVTIAPDGGVLAAEALTLDPAPLTLEAMT
jgi:hypothetical protein